ncbi:hypothetical protein ACFX16_025658 [Malus domestica]
MGSSWNQVTNMTGSTQEQMCGIFRNNDSEGDSSDDDVTYQENSSSDILNMAQVQHNDETTPYYLENVPLVEDEIDSITIDLVSLPRIDENKTIIMKKVVQILMTT